MLLLFSAFMGQATIADAAGDAAITGTWALEGGGVRLELVLNPDTTGSFNGTTFTWSYAGTTLRFLSPNQGSIDYNAVVRGDSLELSGGDLGFPVTFQRQQKAAPSPSPSPAPAAPAKAGGSLVGTWSFTSGANRVVLELAADKTGKINGAPIKWRHAPPELVVTATDGQTFTYQVTLRGDALDVSGGGLPQQITMQRQGATPAAPPKAAGGITGTWLYSDGNVRTTLDLRADGSGTFNGAPFTWKYAGTTLTVTGGGVTKSYNAVVRGDSLDVSGGDLPGPATLRRQGAAAPAGAADTSGVAGVYSCTESSIDPTIAILYTQYVTLYPDGTVGYQKSEGGASRVPVTQSLERFRSWHQGGPQLGNAGRWESNGGTIVVRWRYWNNLVSRGQVDLASGRISLSGMGVLEEGKTLVFKRE